MTDDERVKHVTEIMNLIEAYRRGQDVESWHAVMRKLFDVIGVKDETPPEPAGGAPTLTGDIDTIRDYLRAGRDWHGYRLSELLLAISRVLLEVALNAAEDAPAPQVHIPGLDQTVWDEAVG